MLSKAKKQETIQALEEYDPDCWRKLLVVYSQRLRGHRKLKKDKVLWYTYEILDELKVVIW